MKSSLKQFILKKGVMYGVILSCVALLEYVIDKDLLLNGWIQGFTFIAVIIIMIFSVREFRVKHNDKYIEFKEAFSIAFAVVALIFLLATISNILLYHVIDPSLVNFTVDGTMENTVKIMEYFGGKQEDINTVLVDLEESLLVQFSPIGLLTTYVKGLIFWAIISLLVAAATKKSRPLFDDTLN